MATGSSNIANFIFQLVEAISALSLPLGGGLVAYAKWKKNAERDRRARETAATIASERAAKEARADEANLRNQLLAEKDATIARLGADLLAERTENAALHEQLQRQQRGM